jgi:molecular chaperone DnaJ
MIVAMNHAKTAVQMEPNNAEYQRVLFQLQNAGRMYQQQSRGFGMPAMNVGNLCLGALMANLCCAFCGRC